MVPAQEILDLRQPCGHAGGIAEYVVPVGVEGRLQDEVRFLKYLFEYFLVSLDLPADVS